jgi:hypothetical protein
LALKCHQRFGDSKVRDSEKKHVFNLKLPSHTRRRKGGKQSHTRGLDPWFQGVSSEHATKVTLSDMHAKERKVLSSCLPGRWKKKDHVLIDTWPLLGMREALLEVNNGDCDGL